MSWIDLDERMMLITIVIMVKQILFSFLRKVIDKDHQEQLDTILDRLSNTKAI